MSSSILKKVWRDLTGHKGRSALTIAGLCIGFWGVGSASVAWLLLNHDLDANFLQTNPPAITMTIEGTDVIDVRRLGPIEGVLDIENRPQLGGRVQYAPNRWLRLILWVVEDFTDLRVGVFYPQDGELPPQPGTIVVERDALPIVNLLKRREQSGVVGHGAPVVDPEAPFVRFEDAPVPIQLEGGIDASVTISGTVFDPRQAPSRMEMAVYAYAERDTVAGWGAVILDRLLVTPATGHEDPAAIRLTAERLEARLTDLGYTVVETQYPSHTEHVHQFQMNSILWLISGVGLLALLMSAVLVVNLISGIMTDQVRQIGVLKAIGASARQLTLMYVGAMAAIGLIAAMIALPFALKTGFAVSDGLAAQLNFELLTRTLSPWMCLGFLALACLFPVVAALPTIRRWSAVPVTDALQHFGASPDDENMLLVRRIASLLTLDARMGLRNAFRRPQRMLLTAATFGLGVLVFLVAMNTRSSLLYTAETEEATRLYDVIVGFEEPIDARRVAWMNAFNIVESAETWRIERAAIVNREVTQEERFRLFRVPDGSGMMQPKVLSGRWLEEDNPDGVIVNHRLLQMQPELEPGASIRLDVDGRQWDTRVVGVIKEFGGASMYVRDAFYREQLDSVDDRVNAGFVRLKEPNEKNLAVLTGLLESHFEMVDVRIRGVQSGKIASRIIRSHIDSIVNTLLVLALLVLSVSILGMTSAISTSIVERSRELATLRTIGGTPAVIRRILSSEAITIALIGWMVALALAAVLSPAVSSFFGTALVEYPFDFRYSLIGTISSLGISLLFAVLASTAPARLVNRQSIIRAIQASS